MYKNIFLKGLSLIFIIPIFCLAGINSGRMMRIQSFPSCDIIKDWSIKGVKMACATSIILALHDQSLCQNGSIHPEKYGEICDPTHLQVTFWAPAVLLTLITAQKSYSYAKKKMLELFDEGY